MKYMVCSKDFLGEAFPSTIVCTTGQERSIHGHGNTYNGQFLASEYSFDRQCAAIIVLVRNFPANHHC